MGYIALVVVLLISVGVWFFMPSSSAPSSQPPQIEQGIRAVGAAKDIGRMIQAHDAATQAAVDK